MMYSDCTNTRVSNCTERHNLIFHRKAAILELIQCHSFTNDHKEFPYTIVMKVHGIRKLVQEQHQTKQGEYKHISVFYFRFPIEIPSRDLP